VHGNTTPIDGDDVSLEDGKQYATQHTETQKAQEMQQKPMTTAAMAQRNKCCVVSTTRAQHVSELRSFE